MSTASKDDAFDGLLALVLSVPLIAIHMLFGGWVLTLLWAWFIVPTFAAPALSLPVAMGVELIAWKVAQNKSTPKTEDGPLEAIFKGFVHSVILTTYALCIGFAIQLFV